MSKIPSVQQLTADMTPEDKIKKEQYRTDLIRQCRDFVFAYIENHAAAKIKHRNDVDKRTNAYIFRFSPPSPRGIQTTYYSQVTINAKTNACNFDRMRPHHHNNDLWFFPIFYVMNGVTKNPERTFTKLQLEPVIDQLRTLLETPEKGYRNVSLRFLRDKQNNRLRDCNVVYVEWGAPRVVPTTQVTQSSAAEQDTSSMEVQESSKD
jgi:hypothetical protein